MECYEDDWEHDPGVLVDVAAPHPEHCVGRVHQVGVHRGRVRVLVVMVANVHGGHQRHLVRVVTVLAVIGIGPSVIVVNDVILILSLITVVAVLLLLLYLDTSVASMLLQKSLHGKEPVPVQLNPLVGVAHTGVLYQGTENHEEAHEEVDVYTLHVGHLGQGRIDAVAEGGHGENSGHAQTDPGGGGASVEPE